MTIREAQELVKFMDEKNGSTDVTPLAGPEELYGWFIGLLRLANRSQIDLTGAMVNLPHNIKEWEK